jgi:hypothetical protein
MKVWVRISPCLGGVRISNLHIDPACRFLTRCDSIGTKIYLDVQTLPSEIAEALNICGRCGTGEQNAPSRRNSRAAQNESAY